MGITRFEDLDSWKEARQLVKDTYGAFRQCPDFAFRDQIQRAALSIMANIAEGFERGTNKELVHFLTIARGSAAEVRSFCYAALDLGYLKEETFHNLSSRSASVTNLINGFIRYLRKNERKAVRS